MVVLVGLKIPTCITPLIKGAAIKIVPKGGKFLNTALVPILPMLKSGSAKQIQVVRLLISYAHISIG